MSFVFHRFALLSLIGAAAFSADFTTYIGDSHSYQVTAIATDLAGNTYVTGSRLIPIPALTTEFLTDVFVTKLDASGSVVFTTTFGGKASDQANSVAVDGSGNCTWPSDGFFTIVGADGGTWAGISSTRGRQKQSVI